MKLFWRLTDKKTKWIGSIMLSGIETDLVVLEYHPMKHGEFARWRGYPLCQPGNYQTFTDASLREMKAHMKAWAGDFLTTITTVCTDENPVLVKLG